MPLPSGALRLSLFHEHRDAEPRLGFNVTRSAPIALLAVASRAVTMYWSTGASVYRDTIATYPRNDIGAKSTQINWPPLCQQV